MSITDFIDTGAFWLAFAATLTPAFNAEAAYTASATTAAEEAAAVATFQATLGMRRVMLSHMNR